MRKGWCPCVLAAPGNALSWPFLSLGWKVHQPNPELPQRKTGGKDLWSAGLSRLMTTFKTQGKGPGNGASNAHQYIPCHHLKTCCFHFKVTLEKKMPFQLCLKQEQLCACETRLCCLVMNFLPNLSARRSKLEWKIICWHSPQQYHLPAAVCQILPSVSECPLWRHHGDGDHDRPFKHTTGMSLWRAPSLPLSSEAELSPAQRAEPCGKVAHSLAQCWATYPRLCTDLLADLR